MRNAPARFFEKRLNSFLRIYDKDGRGVVTAVMPSFCRVGSEILRKSNMELAIDPYFIL